MKVKDKFIQEQQEEFEIDLGYEEWLRDNYIEPTVAEVLDMAREQFRDESFYELQWCLIASNNIYYKPNNEEGA